MKLFVVCAILGALAVPAILQTKKPPIKDAKKPTAATRKTPTKAATATSTKPKPKPAAISSENSDAKAEWTRVTSIADRTERIAALEKFITSSPKSGHLNDAKGLIAAARVEAGNDDLAGGNVDGAITEYNAAIAVVPTPVVQGFWDAALAKIPTNIYFRGRREAAVDVAKQLEAKAGANSAQLLSLARFYLTIENGSEAARIATGVISTTPTSGAAYRTLGLADRMEFQLDDSAAAFAKALEIEPDSLDAKQGLAEMKRALGKPDEALALYEAVLATDPDNIQARTGHVLALFDADRRADAEAELTKLTADKPGDFLALGGAAYWYAVHNDGAKAVETAQNAIAVEPRFVWSHIALARGLLLQGHTGEAEKVLVAARRFGNFPTLEYELAVTRFAAGYYREAAEGLSAAFTVKDGQVSTLLGGRIPRGSKDFTSLVQDERRASIFAPTAADDAATSQQLAALLQFQQALNAPSPDETAVSTAADEFTKGNDPMVVHRQVYAASVLLERKIALQKAAEIAKASVSNVDGGLNAPSASTAVMASELYGPRIDAAMKGEYVNVPEIPRATASAILRGRIEEIIGWASYQTGANDDAVVRLRRAVSVLPPNSAWWRSSTWQLGAALVATGKETEALDMYVKSYKASQPDAIRYSVIEALYHKLNGSTDGLTDKIGENPAQAARIPAPAATLESTPLPTPIPTPAPTPDMVSAIPIATPTPTPQFAATTEATSVPISTPTPTPEVIATPTATPEATPTATPTPSPSPTTEPTPSATPEATPSPSPVPAASVQIGSAPTTRTALPGATPDANLQAKTHDLFPPVVITIPSAKGDKSAAAADASPSPSQERTTPCLMTVSNDNMRLNRGGLGQAVIVGREDNGNIDGLETAAPAELAIRREPVVGVASRALFVVRPTTAKAGLYEVTFKLPCGTRTIQVSVH